MKFRKKPIIIEAVQWFPGVRHPGIVAQTETGATIRTLDGSLDAKPGDWIITGIKGEHYPCKPDVFEATYEPVPDGTEDTHS
jgi:hypothetical protein